MLAYWMMYIVPLMGVWFPFRLHRRLRAWLWLIVGAFFVTIIGLRHEVGADWFAYLEYYEFAAVSSLTESIVINDPGYMALNWLSGRLGGGIYMVNVACAAIAVWGLFSLARRQPLPWVALAVAVPYLLMVVAMGYTRQSVAIGLGAAALVALSDGRLARYFFLTALAILFHMTAIVLLLFPFLVATRYRLAATVIVIFLASLLSYHFLSKKFKAMWVIYVEQGMRSEGGLVRILMNSIPALIALQWRNKLLPKSHDGVWLWMSIISILLLPLQHFASTMVDRFALYFAIIQMVVWSRIHLLFSDHAVKAFVLLCVLTIYFTVQWVWLNYSVHAPEWVPYKMYPFI